MSRWLLPLLALLAFATSVSVVTRNPVPLRPSTEKQYRPAQEKAAQSQSNADQSNKKSGQAIAVQQPNAAPQTGAEANARANKQPDQPYSWVENIDGVAAKLSTGDWVALTASVVALLQFAALVGTIFVMVLNGRRQLRAYVFLDTADLINVAPPPEPIAEGQPIPNGARRWPNMGPVAILRLRNSGQTPAYDLIHWASIQLREYPLITPPPAPAPPDANTTVFSLAPGTISVKNIAMPIILSDVDIAELRATPPTKAIYIFGRVTYRDAFRKKRFTNYRFRHNAISGNVGVSGELTGADEGNSAN